MSYSLSECASQPNVVVVHSNPDATVRHTTCAADQWADQWDERGSFRIDISHLDSNRAISLRPTRSAKWSIR